MIVTVLANQLADGKQDAGQVLIISLVALVNDLVLRAVLEMGVGVMRGGLLGGNQAAGRIMLEHEGRIVRLRNARQFKGWVGMNGSRRLLFSDGRNPIELKRAPDRGFEVSSAQKGCQYVARDGSLETL